MLKRRADNHGTEIDRGRYLKYRHRCRWPCASAPQITTSLLPIVHLFISAVWSDAMNSNISARSVAV